MDGVSKNETDPKKEMAVILRTRKKQENRVGKLGEFDTQYSILLLFLLNWNILKNITF